MINRFIFRWRWSNQGVVFLLMNICVHDVYMCTSAEYMCTAAVYMSGPTSFYLYLNVSVRLTAKRRNVTKISNALLYTILYTVQCTVASTLYCTLYCTLVGS